MQRPAQFLALQHAPKPADLVRGLKKWMIPVDGYVLPLDDILNLADRVWRDIPDALNVPWNEQEIPGIDVPLLDEAAGLLWATAGIVLVHQAALVVHEVVQVAAGASQALP